MIETVTQEHGITIAKRPTSEVLLFDHGPFAQILAKSIRMAQDAGASDVHIEPHELGLQIRIRVDGNLRVIQSIEDTHRESLILEAKRVFGLNIGLSGQPQDSRISISSLKLDLRVSLLPTQFGEKIVLRLLDLNSQFCLERLGFDKNALAVLKKSVAFENGVVIISGPTGSGKTKTLYSILNEANPFANNIVTLEDPIEFRLAGLNQVQITEKVTFADALRSVLRQDPDVILVGEIRDPETAKLCFQAAETGHLVFSTLHANGAIEIVERLKGLGIDETKLKSNLRLSFAQRLEQLLCPRCKVKISEHGFKANANGCEFCNHGVKGRMPVLEWAANRFGDFKICQTLDGARAGLAQQGLIEMHMGGADELE